MADPSGIYDVFMARFLDAPTTISMQVDMATPDPHELHGTFGKGDAAVAITGKWWEGESHIAFNDALVPGDIIYTHFFDGYVSSEAGGYVAGLAGTYHDVRLDLRGGVLNLVTDNGGWSASRVIVTPASGER